jgi:hypothetical protein
MDRHAERRGLESRRSGATAADRTELVSAIADACPLTFFARWLVGQSLRLTDAGAGFDSADTRAPCPFDPAAPELGWWVVVEWYDAATAYALGPESVPGTKWQPVAAAFTAFGQSSHADADRADDVATG